MTKNAVEIPEIKILHLSDLHYDSSKPNDTQIILDALWKDLDYFPGIDFIVFSGDLVKVGDKKDDFEKALQTFIKPLLEKSRLDISDFFITPGNHDIQMSKIDDYLEEGFKSKLKNREKVNEYLDKQMQENFKKIEILEHFNEFKNGFKADNIKTSNKLYSTHIILKKNVKIGIACLNTCWRATGAPDDGDRGKLLIGESQIYTALNDIKGCSIKIALYHHPLDCLTEYDQGDAERWLSMKFDLLFCGHLHNPNIRLVQYFENKAVLVQGGSLNNGRKYYNGYSVLCYNVQKNEGTIYLRSYFDDPMVFDKAVDRCPNGEISIQLRGTVGEKVPTFNGTIDHKRVIDLIETAKKTGKRDSVINSLINEISKREDHTERYWIYIALGTIGGKKAEDAIRRGLSEANDFARNGAIKARDLIYNRSSHNK